MHVLPVPVLPVPVLPVPVLPVPVLPVAPAGPAGAAGLDPAQLLALVAEVAADARRWRDAVRPDPVRRSWARLPAPPGVDLWVLGWLPAQSTELHDHGGSTAAFRVLSGVVEEVRPRRGRLRTTLLGPGRTRLMPPGEVHDVRGSAGGPALSLHAYSPPLTRMTWYDAALRPTRTGAPEQ